MVKYGERAVGESDIFVGLDIHRRQWYVTILAGDADVFTGSIPGTWAALSAYLRRYTSERVFVVYEAGFSGFWLYDRIREWGGRCIVTPPSLVPLAYGNRVKTDKRDSRKLAWLLSRGLLKSVWVPDERQRGHREVLRHRQQLVQDCVRVQSRIKSALYLYGIDLMGRCGRWTGVLVSRLQKIQLPDQWAQASYERLLGWYGQLTEQVAAQTRLLRQLGQTDDYRESVALLSTLPGVGIITAMTLLLELGDITRFRRADQIAAYVGLTPAQYSSGDHVRMGRITGMGKNHLRGLLIEAAWVAVRRDGRFGDAYDRIKHRAGSKRAIVAVARHLLLCARRMLLDGRPYQSPATI